MTRSTVEWGLAAENDVARMLMPEQRLALAVLENAVAAFQRHALAGGPRFAEARDWLFSDEARWPFAFVNVCAALGFEPHYVRCGLAAWLSHAHALATSGNLVPFAPSRRGHPSRRFTIVTPPLPRSSRSRSLANLTRGTRASASSWRASRA